MSDLTEWLLACIAEDEAVARRKGADAMTGHRWKHAPESVYQEIQSEVLENCRHVLAVCKAHREIVERHSQCDDVSFGDAWTCPDFRAIASIYADRPGWREEWAS